MAAHVFPRAQARQAPGLLQQAVARHQFVVGAGFLGDVSEHKHHAGLVVDIDRLCRHQARNAPIFALCQQVQAIDLAIALQGLQQLGALVLGGPNAQILRGAANDFFTRQAQHLAKRRIHF